jgi:recombination protein RecT
MARPAQKNARPQATGTQMAVVENINRFKNELVLRRSMTAPMLPSHIKIEKFESAVFSAVGANPKLLECDRVSLLKACAEAAELGLSLNPVMRHADILPVWDGRSNSLKAQFRPRYMGLMELAKRSGEVLQIYAHTVHENDVFDYQLGLNKRLDHVPASSNRGTVTGAYCVWKDRNGLADFEYMPIEDIRKIMIRSSSKDKNGNVVGPWVSDFEEMCRKTVVRRASKYMPVSTESAFGKAVTLDDRREGGEIVSMEDGEVTFGSEFDIPEEPAGESAPAQQQMDDLEQRVVNRQAPKPQPAAAAPQRQQQPQQEPPKPAAKPANGEVPVPRRQDGSADWDAWAKRCVGQIEAATDEGALQAFEEANQRLISQCEFNAPDTAATVKQAIESKSVTLFG